VLARAHVNACVPANLDVRAHVNACVPANLDVRAHVNACVHRISHNHRVTFNDKKIKIKRAETSDNMLFPQDKSTKIWIRPGVSFWEGKNGSFLEDDITKQLRKINSTAYSILQKCHGLTVREIIDLSREEFEECGNIDEEIIKFLLQLKNEGLILEASPKDHYGITYFPLGLVFCELTHSCNFRCITCYNESGQPNEKEMVASEWKIAFEKIADVSPQIQSTVILTGGEPLFRKDFFEIASYAKDLGLSIQLFTNGSLINHDVAERIASLGIDYVRISVDGASPETNDKIRGRGNYEKATNAMRYLTDLNIKVCWQSIISQINFNEMDEMLESAISFGLDGFRISSLDPIGRGKSIEDLCLYPNQEYALWRFLKKAALDQGNKIKIGWGADYCIDIDWKRVLLIPQVQSTSEIDQRPELIQKYMANSMCGVGVKSCLITPSGDIALCPLLTATELRMGNVLRDNLADIWTNGTAFRLLREKSLTEFEECKSCGFRYTCTGGCRGLAYVLNGSLTACDPKRASGLEYFKSIFVPPCQ
jgi:radical SAM protein with 4Fe4S-binding SPASM domain